MPIAKPDASVSRVNGIEKSGGSKTGAWVIACFSLSKASWDSDVHTNWSLQNNLVNGAAMRA